MRGVDINSIKKWQLCHGTHVNCVQTRVINSQVKLNTFNLSFTSCNVTFSLNPPPSTIISSDNRLYFFGQPFTTNRLDNRSRSAGFQPSIWRSEKNEESLFTPGLLICSYNTKGRWLWFFTRWPRDITSIKTQTYRVYILYARVLSSNPILQTIDFFIIVFFPDF